MKLQKQTVYLPVKVEDELPEKGKMVFTFGNFIKDRVNNPPIDDGLNMQTTCRVETIPNQCEKWYDENWFPVAYSKVHTWLKEDKVFVFTPEQFNEYTTNVIQQTLEVAAGNVEADFEPMGWLAEQHAESPFIEGEDYEIGISRSSITDLFEEIFKNLKLQ